ncbi:MAG: hypothetical protein AAF193_09960 [Bacteroidota bacterium]
MKSVFLLLTILSCATSSVSQSLNSTSSNYVSTKSFVSQQRDSLLNQNPSLEELSVVFEYCLMEKIIPCWYGTKWSFEGHTNNPKEGEIACGYFVSTTLKHIGVPLNRYRLAQQNPLNEAKTLAMGTEVLTIEYEDLSQLKVRLNKAVEEGVYFIGFDEFHVGFAHVKGDRIFLIHSNFIGSKGVVNEDFFESEVVGMCNRIHLVNLHQNEMLLKAWMNGEEIPIVRGK